MLYEIQSTQPVCPYCERRISPWHDATGKTVEVNGHVYHKICIIGLQVSDMVDGQWKKQKIPSRPRSAAITAEGLMEP